jgi:hypothetical protein
MAKWEAILDSNLGPIVKRSSGQLSQALSSSEVAAFDLKSVFHNEADHEDEEDGETAMEKANEVIQTA